MESQKHTTRSKAKVNRFIKQVSTIRGIKQATVAALVTEPSIIWASSRQTLQKLQPTNGLRRDWWTFEYRMLRSGGG